LPSTAAPARIPKWTKRVVTELGGRDPLGLSRASFMITDYLVKGIITTTSRARYYSFYPWALWHIEQSEEPKRYAEFTAAFRRREAFLALSTLQHNTDSTSVVGADAVRPKLGKYRDIGEADTNFAVLPSNVLGGYGQYYGGSLYALGLTHRTEDGIDRTASGRGEALARAFDHSVAQTQYSRQAHFQERVIPFDVLKKSAERFSLDSLDEERASEERELLRNLFFSWDRSDLADTDLLRRHTLGLILHTVSEYGKAGFKPTSDSTSVDHYLVYPPYYYGVLWRDDDPAVPYQPPAALATCYGFWQQFCAHEYLTQALENLLYCTLETLNLQPSGMALHDVCANLTGQKFGTTLAGLFGGGSSPGELMAALGLDAVPSESQGRAARAEIGATSDRSEWALVARDGKPDEVAAAAVGLLAVLYLKWRNAGNEFVRYIGTKAGANLWTGVVLPSLDEWLRPDLDWNSALASLIEHFVLHQHDRVMYEKGRLESCWLHRLDGKIHKDQDYQPVFRASRHWNCVRILRDIGLLEFGGDSEMTITSDGKRVLSRILKSDGTHK
jgi:hypothetical protein